MEEAQTLHRLAGEAARAGNHEEALLLLGRAAELAPGWPQPPYDMAFIHLLRQQFPEALSYYRKVDELEPQGFFNSKTAVWALEKEEAGVYPAGLYLSYAQHEWMPDKEARINLLRRIAEKYPSFAPAWKELANLLDDTDARREVIERGLSCRDVDLQTKGNLLINEALVTQLKGDQPGAKRQLQALLGGELTPSDRALAEFVLSTIP